MQTERAKKPLGTRAYGSIPHLPGSRLGSGDHHCEFGQARIATEKTRDKHDVVIVQEKLDGSNVAIAKINGVIYPLMRAGYTAISSPYEQHHKFHAWVMERESFFNYFLQNGERICGEWLAQAHGTIYNLHHDPFVAFDIFYGKERLNYLDFSSRCGNDGIMVPYRVHTGDAISVESVMSILETSGHGAADPVEGAVWRVERKGKLDFICKYVRHDKLDGKYLPENNNGIITWNL